MLFMEPFEPHCAMIHGLLSQWSSSRHIFPTCGGTEYSQGVLRVLTGYPEYSLEAHLPDLQQLALSIHNGGATRRIPNGSIKAKGTTEGRC